MYLMWFSVPCFGVSLRCLTLCLLLCTLKLFSPVWVAKWPHFGKELPSLLAVCSHCTLSICNSSYFPFWIWAGFGFCVLVAFMKCIYPAFSRWLDKNGWTKIRIMKQIGLKCHFKAKQCLQDIWIWVKHNEMQIYIQARATDLIIIN